MPIFEFRCRKCQLKFEEFVFSASSDLSEIKCPACGEKAPEKLISAFCSVGNTGGGSYAGASPSCGGGGFS